MTDMPDLDLAAIRSAAAAGLVVQSSAVLALLDQIAGFEATLALLRGELAEQRKYIHTLHALLLAWAQAIERRDLSAVERAQQPIVAYVAGAQ